MHFIILYIETFSNHGISILTKSIDTFCIVVVLNTDNLFCLLSLLLSLADAGYAMLNGAKTTLHDRSGKLLIHNNFKTIDHKTALSLLNPVIYKGIDFALCKNALMWYN